MTKPSLQMQALSRALQDSGGEAQSWEQQGANWDESNHRPGEINHFSEEGNLVYQKQHYERPSRAPLYGHEAVGGRGLLFGDQRHIPFYTGKARDGSPAAVLDGTGSQLFRARERGVEGARAGGGGAILAGLFCGGAGCGGGGKDANRIGYRGGEDVPGHQAASRAQTGNRAVLLPALLLR